MRKGYGDSIKIWVDTGNISADGGNGYYSGGTITSTPTINFTNPDNTIEKAHVEGDVHQINKLWADQSVNVYAGNGGDGGHHNMAVGGPVTINLTDVDV